MLLSYNLRIRNTDPRLHIVSCYKKHFLGLKLKMLFLVCGMLLYLDKICFKWNEFKDFSAQFN